jgi:membrane protein YdbS with pleckstrin-like domain
MARATTFGEKGISHMNCGACGGEVPSGAAFCSHCGASLTEDRSAGAERLRPRGRSSSGQPRDEEELWSGTYSPKAMVGQAGGLAVLTVLGAIGASLAGPLGWIAWVIGAIALWGVLGLVILYRRLTVRYRLTTFRLFHETGLLSRTRDRIEVIDINDVTLRQGVIERMFNVGTIHVQSSDVTSPKLDLKGIEDVRRVTDLIDDTRRAERQRRGLFMENIGGTPA